MGQELFSDLSDEALMKEFYRCSEDAFTVLVGRWQRPIWVFFWRSGFSADDLTQDVFVRLYETKGKPTKFDPKRASFKTFIFTIASNLVKDEWRRIIRHPNPVSLGMSMPDPVDPDSNVSDGAKLKELRQAIAECSRGLSWQ